jgi:predicted proteasome-type protease
MATERANMRLARKFFASSRRADQRGIDNVAVYRKLSVLEHPSERVIAVSTAGNLPSGNLFRMSRYAF